MARSNWVVSISSEHEDPEIYGPFSKTRAVQIKEAFNRREERRTEAAKLGDFLTATAYPLERPTIPKLLARYFD